MAKTAMTGGAGGGPGEPTAGGGRRHDPAADPDRLGRTGGRRGGGTVAGAIARRTGGRRPAGAGPGRRRPGGGGAGATTFAGRGGRQRVVVKALVVRHAARGGGSRGAALARHVRYLGRDGASLAGGRGEFYSAREESLDGREATAGWAGDRHHFRLIVSPERAADLPDLRAYVRETMARVERDLATELEWVAVNHHDTDNPHAHVLVRGVRGDGTDLVVRRPYMAHGFRDRAAEVATELLGERTPAEVRRDLEREVTAERATSLDRAVGNRLEDDLYRPSRTARGPRAYPPAHLVAGRLQFLGRLGLAEKARGGAWRVVPNFLERLRDLGDRNDIIRRLHRPLGRDAANVHRASHRPPDAPPLAGVVVARGAPDEVVAARYVVIRDAAGALHYAEVRDADAYRALAVGDRAEVGRAAHRRWLASREVLAAATPERDGAGASIAYAVAAHRASLEAAGRRDAARVAEVHGRYAEAWAGRRGSGVERTGDGVYRVDPAALDRFLTRLARGPADVRAVGGRSSRRGVDRTPGRPARAAGRRRDRGRDFGMEGER